MSDWNLPPGCTSRDIDRAAGEYEEDCAHCNRTVMANELNEAGLCETCAEEREREEAEDEEEQP